MSRSPGGRPLLLVVGGCGGLVGRAVLEEFSRDHEIRSVHRHPVAQEAERGVEWVRGDAATVGDWTPLLAGVDTVLNLAWYRQSSARRFSRLAAGLIRLVEAADRAGVPRFTHVSVPDAPEEMERNLPYLAFKRSVDRALAGSRLPYAIVRPTMLFAERDVLLTVMLRTMARYRRLPMFGDGSYHISPLAVRDLARILRRETARGARATVNAGGPDRWVYRSLTDRLFEELRIAPRYFTLSPTNSVRLARFLETFGSSLLYAYEVKWLLSDLLGLPAYEGLDPPLEPVGPFLRREAARVRG
ncbi:MAG: SDR family oxidoreductase [Thermoplasmata archaeon]